MIYGIGNDLAEISRIKKSMENDRFAAFVFSKRERALFARNCAKLTGCFAAKEALAKALGTGVRGFSLDEISVLRDELGKPYFEFEGCIEEIVTREGLTAHLSLTDTDELCCAFVVLERQTAR
ncbi:MAG: holo-ACP synthase [Oscillospiraceae bacterium]